MNKYLLPIAAILLLIGTTLPEINGQEVTPWHIATMKSVSATQISEDGNYAAYILSTPANPLEKNATPSTSLHVIDLATNEVMDIDAPGNIGGLSYRPEKSSFTVITKFEEDDNNSIAELCLKSKKLTKLFSFNTNIAGYQWNPDGEYIAFMANLPSAEKDNPLPYSPEIYEEGLVNRKAWIARVSSSWPDIRKVNVPGSSYIIEWSPDGTKLAVSAASTPHVDDRYMFQKVHVVDGATGFLLNEINNKGKIVQIKWSPNGQKLALLAGNDLHDLIAGRIMMVDATGGNPYNIFPDYQGKFESIQWISENQIQVLASESTARVYGTIRPDGTNYQKTLRGKDLAFTSYSRASDGSVVLLASTPQHPTEIYHMKEGQKTPVRKTHHNPWLKDVKFGKQEVVSYAARDGEFDIDGMLILPVNYEKGKSYPLIVMVHGGPEAHYSNGWLTAYSMPGQLGASRGFAVFYPNYRGSTGRGIEFTMSSQRDLSGKEFDDIVDGVDYLIERGIADADRVGVTGGSYGGYATAWMSTYYSDRFAAGVMFVGISNNLSKWGTSDIPEELYLVHSRQRLWEDWMNYLKRSPVYYVDRSETPLLIMHGKEDTRVHPGQSLELYRHLKVRKPEVPLRLVWYPGEGHGNRKATSRFDYNLRMMEWFETYLLEKAETLPDKKLNLDKAGIPQEVMQGQ
nr:S9 family peptidase [Saprospiraceae bacterium]